MGVLAYGRNSGPSGRDLAWALGMPAIKAYGAYDYLGSDVSINWTGMYMDNRALNRNTYGTKLDQLMVWDRAGLPCVRFSTTPLETWLPRSFYHSGGKDFSRNIIPDFWTKPVRSITEWRVHVFRKSNGAIGHPADYVAGRIGWKTRGDLELRGVEASGVPIRSRRHGWRLKYFANPTRCPYPELMTLAKWAVCIQGWDFGAVDVLQTSDDNFVLLEANACPGLKDAKTLETYASNIRAMLNQ